MNLDGVHFSKMHGLGNDFVVLDGHNFNRAIETKLIKFLANRRLGIGCDQVLYVGPTNVPGVDFEYRIFNADATEVEQCGNGARCVGRYLFERGYATRTSVTLICPAGLIHLSKRSDSVFEVDMGEPVFAPAQVPFLENQSESYDFLVSSEKLVAGVLSIGNPHIIVEVEDIKNAPVFAWGPVLHDHPKFPNNVNVNFMEIVDAHSIRVRTYERGGGEPLACGSGACASAVWGIQRRKVRSPVSVGMKHGNLKVVWKPRRSVLMSGPAEFVYDGHIPASQLAMLMG